jgi:RNA polymerase sigma factor (sigma-70 family)
MKPLLPHLRRGERAFERIYRRHVGDVYRYALVLLRNPDEAEHVTQTTFLDAYRTYARGERPRNPHAWLLALAHGVCRQRTRTSTESDVAVDDDFAARAVPDEAPPTPSDIRRALARLPFTQRAALVMRELESRPYAEIAEVLDLPAAAVETLIFEGRRALREQFEGTLTCHEAERAISRRIDGRLRRSERKPLRRHLRGCAECAGFARSQRAQRPAWRTLANAPVPVSLHSFFGPGGVMDRAAAKRVGTVSVGALSRTLAIAAVGASAVGLAYENLGGAGPALVLRTAPEQAAPSPSAARPAGRPSAPPARARAAKAGARTAPRSAPQQQKAPNAVRVLRAKPTAAAPKAAVRKTAPTRSQTFAIRAPAKPKPTGQTQRAGSRRSEPPKQTVRPEAATETTEPPAPPPAPPPPAPPVSPPLPMPGFPQTPPLPLPLPEPPKLP